jgi:hypothetical protein
MAVKEPTQRKRYRTGGFFTNLKRFLSAQKDVLMARASTPAMHGINLVQNDYTPSRLAEHPGCCSYEDIEPMK